MITIKKHSNVYYIYKSTGFEPVKKAKAFKNDMSLDLFTYLGTVYEGQTGLRICNINEMDNQKEKVEQLGGLDRLNELIQTSITKTGLSLRYTRPNEKRQEVFNLPQKDPNIIYAEDAYNKKHYYLRFHNENGIEFFTLNKATDIFKTVFVQCNGFMLGIGQQHSLENIKKWLAGLQNGVKGEVERQFNESLANPQKIADLGFANVLGRYDEAVAHNAPIHEARRIANQERDLQREAKRSAKEQATRAEYEQAIKTAESNLLNGKPVTNQEIDGKSLILQLFREHEINIPLKTQGWIINSLSSICYGSDNNQWTYSYCGNKSTVLSSYATLLYEAVKTKQQFEGMSKNSDNPNYDTHIEDENDMEIG